MKRARTTLAALAVIGIVAATVTVVAVRRMDSGTRAREPPMAVESNATVVHVIDGDTVEARVQGRNEHVRLIGIDTPETVAPNKPVMCFGPEASAETHRLLPDGTKVRLVRDTEARDVYGRLLAYIYRADDGVFVNLVLARDGFADVLAIPPNTAHGDELRAAVTDARRARRGLWGACQSFGQPVASSA